MSWLWHLAISFLRVFAPTKKARCCFNKDIKMILIPDLNTFNDKQLRRVIQINRSIKQNPSVKEPVPHLENLTRKAEHILYLRSNAKRKKYSRTF